jgi:hypothetical protein
VAPVWGVRLSDAGSWLLAGGVSMRHAMKPSEARRSTDGRFSAKHSPASVMFRVMLISLHPVAPKKGIRLSQQIVSVPDRCTGGLPLSSE